MNSPQPTSRKICPYLTAGTVQVSSLVGAAGEKPGATISPIQCLGPQCHMWEHDSRLPAETGDCSMKLTAVFSATSAVTAQQLVQLLARVAVKAGVEGITIEDAPAAAPAASN